MSVLDRGYKRWTGTPVSPRRRLLVIPRYALADLIERRFTLMALALCLIPPLVLAGMIYAAANLETIARVLNMRGTPRIDVGPSLFAVFTQIQCWGAVLLTVLAGPRMVVRDVADNALCLYFSKSLTRLDYALGKWAALAILLSTITWLPLLLNFGLQMSLATPEWRSANAWIGLAITLSCLALIALLCTLVTAASAWMKRTLLAQAAFLGAALVLHGFAMTLFSLSGFSFAIALSPLAALADLRTWAFTAPGANSTAELGALGSAAAIVAWTLGGVALFLKRLSPVEVVR